VAEALEVGDQGGQTRPDQTASSDVPRQRRPAGLLAAGTPVLGEGVFLNGQLGRLDVDLLDDSDQLGVAAQRPTAARAAVKGVVKEVLDLVLWEQGAFMPGMSGLSAALALVLASRREAAVA